MRYLAAVGPVDALQLSNADSGIFEKFVLMGTFRTSPASWQHEQPGAGG
jgi:hypothetical protein